VHPIGGGHGTRRPEAKYPGALVRACGFALTTAELAASGRIPAPGAVSAIAAELDDALRQVGVDIGDLARAYARHLWRSDH